LANDGTQRAFRTGDPFQKKSQKKSNSDVILSEGAMLITPYLQRHVFRPELIDTMGRVGNTDAEVIAGKIIKLAQCGVTSEADFHRYIAAER
jgi:hypothetical protein